MGLSEYDAASLERRAWNAGRKLGTKRALEPQQVWAIRFWLTDSDASDTAHCSSRPFRRPCARSSHEGTPVNRSEPDIATEAVADRDGSLRRDSLRRQVAPNPEDHLRRGKIELSI
jgi:hypothetical protein